MTRHRIRLALLSALFVVMALPASASAASGGDSLRTTFLFSRSMSGGVPDGPSRNGAISHDQRIARVMAYESDATNIVAGDTNGVTDVFLVRRQAPWGNNGTPWNMGATELVSKGYDGSPANGASSKPVVDGASHNKPSCIGFVSEASNLVRGDTNGVADAFVYNLSNGKIERVSVDSSGKQANGPSFDISVSGDCLRVAFTSSATNLGLKSVSNRAWRSARVSGSSGGFKQVYVHVRNGKSLDKAFKGMTFMASASDQNRPGNADSYEPYFARAGKAVVFTSEANNLERGDGNGASDIYERTFTRYYAHINGKGTQTLKLDTRVVSANGGRAGNGASTHPSVTDDGRYVAYETLASNLLPGDSNGVSDVSRADMKKSRPKQKWVSKSFIGIGNGASNRPVISDAGEFVLFDSDSTIFKPSDSVRDDDNGVRDLFLWNAPTGNTSLESRDWDNGYLNAASQNPATSSRGNYVLFESTAESIDQLIANQTGIQQVYLRYLGPK